MLEVPATLIESRRAEIARRDPFIDWHALMRVMIAAERAMGRSDHLTYAAQDDLAVSVNWYGVVREINDWRYTGKSFTIESCSVSSRSTLSTTPSAHRKKSRRLASGAVTTSQANEQSSRSLRRADCNQFDRTYSGTENLTPRA
jgi:hypothetical protein